MSSKNPDPAGRQFPHGAPDDRPTVLVVDDNDVFRIVFAEVLRRDGMRVVEAAGGEAAFAVLEEFTQSRKEDPALLVLDLMMPVMSGVEVVERLRRTSRWARLPVLLMTAANDPMLPMMLKAPVVFKPDTDALLNAVRKTVIRHQVTPNAKVDSTVEGNFPCSNRDARARFKRRAL